VVNVHLRKMNFIATDFSTFASRTNVHYKCPCLFSAKPWKISYAIKTSLMGMSNKLRPDRKELFHEHENMLVR